MSRKPALAILTQNQNQAWMNETIDELSEAFDIHLFRITTRRAHLEELRDLSPLITLIDCNTIRISNLKGLLNKPKPFATYLLCVCDSPSALSEYEMIDFIAPADTHYITTNCNRLSQNRHFQSLKDQQLEMLRSNVLNTVVHEFATPIHHIKAGLKQLQDQAGYAENTLDMVLQAASRLETHLTRLRSLRELGPVKIEACHALDPYYFALKTIKKHFPHTDEVDRITITYPVGIPALLTDAKKIGIVMQELIINALKNSKDQVLVTYTHIDNVVRIQIQDFGVGMDKDTADKVFDTFYQLHSNKSQPYEGLGIGLSITKSILDNLGISCIINSVLDEGTTIWFDVPVVRENV